MTITDQLTKWIIVIPGRDTWTAEQWALAFHRSCYAGIGLSDKMISIRLSISHCRVEFLVFAVVIS